MPPTESSSKLPWIVAVAGVVAVVAAGWYLQRPAPRPAPPTTAVTAAPAETAPTGPQYPVEAIEQAITPQASDPLPDLFSSDGYVLDALNQLLAHPQLAEWLVSEHLIARFVAFVDAATGPRIAINLWPAKPVSGRFLVQDENGLTVISGANSSRYDDRVRLFSGIDTQAAVALYLRLYPLCQQAYRELGYPQGHFNDRLVAVIDHLLAAPEPAVGMAVRLNDKGNYAYVAAELEGASAGQKFLMRMGPAHEAAVKAKLREFRAALAGAPVR
jgi:hypothetical protein